MIYSLDSLHKDVALKLDNQIYLGLEEVKTCIDNHPKLFQELICERIKNSHMVYGYNQLGNPIKLGFEDGLIIRIVLITEEIKQKRYVGVISYDGHQYNGFQIQDSQPTIQGELSKVVSSINTYETLVQGASRTDAGVHALNYTFHFDTEKSLTPSKWFRILNMQLPNDILLKSIRETHPLFHSRYDVYKKRYVYQIKLGQKDPLRINYEWNVPEIDVDKIKENLNQLIGTHDFKSFCKGNPESTIRTIYETTLMIDGDKLTFVFEGNGFLRYMIRILVNTLIDIGAGKLDLTIEEIIKEKSRKHTKKVAPASGLYLEDIIY